MDLKFLFKNSFLNYLSQIVLAWASPHLSFVTLVASLVWYECDSREKRFQEQLQPIFSRRKYKNFITAYLSAKLLKTN